MEHCISQISKIFLSETHIIIVIRLTKVAYIILRMVHKLLILGLHINIFQRFKEALHLLMVMELI
jgi:hypothetical protein